MLISLIAMTSQMIQQSKNYNSFYVMSYTINPNFAQNSHENVEIKGNTSLNNQFFPIGRPKTLTMRCEFSRAVDDRDGAEGRGYCIMTEFLFDKINFTLNE